MTTSSPPRHPAPPRHPILGCTCPEGRYRLTGERPAPIVFAPPVHDCAYIAWRNALIPRAAREAYWRADAKDPEWSREFMAAMNRLAAKARPDLPPRPT